MLNIKIKSMELLVGEKTLQLSVSVFMGEPCFVTCWKCIMGEKGVSPMPRLWRRRDANSIQSAVHHFWSACCIRACGRKTYNRHGWKERGCHGSHWTVTVTLVYKSLHQVRRKKRKRPPCTLQKSCLLQKLFSVCWKWWGPAFKDKWVLDNCKSA